MICRIAVLGGLCCTLSAAGAEATPVLWGVDEDDGQLYSVEDYTTATGFTDYGLLMFQTAEGLRPVSFDGPSEIESFEITPDGLAYMSINKDIGGFDGPVLASFDLNGATTTGPNVINLIGTINIIVDSTSDDITGLAINPLTGDLDALFRDEHTGADQLLIIDPATGEVIDVVGLLQGLGEIVGDGEALEFDPPGNLYVTDAQDDHLYQVDPLTGAIIAVLDNAEGSVIGDPSTDVRIEGLGWDPETDRLIGSDDVGGRFLHLTFDNGNNTSFGGFAEITDPAGIDFVPPGIPTAVLIPAPNRPLLLTLRGAYPNPFRSATRLSYALPAAGWVSLRIVDVQGHQVEPLVGAWQEAGEHEFVWNAGTRPYGLYFVIISSGGVTRAERLIHVR